MQNITETKQNNTALLLRLSARLINKPSKWQRNGFSENGRLSVSAAMQHAHCRPIFMRINNSWAVEAFAKSCIRKALALPKPTNMVEATCNFGIIDWASNPKTTHAEVMRIFKEAEKISRQPTGKKYPTGHGKDDSVHTARDSGAAKPIKCKTSPVIILNQKQGYRVWIATVGGKEVGTIKKNETWLEGNNFWVVSYGDFNYPRRTRHAAADYLATLIRTGSMKTKAEIGSNRKAAGKTYPTGHGKDDSVHTAKDSAVVDDTPPPTKEEVEAAINRADASMKKLTAHQCLIKKTVEKGRVLSAAAARDVSKAKELSEKYHQLWDGELVKANENAAWEARRREAHDKAYPTGHGKDDSVHTARDSGAADMNTTMTAGVINKSGNDTFIIRGRFYDDYKYLMAKFNIASQSWECEEAFYRHDLTVFMSAKAAENALNDWAFKDEESYERNKSQYSVIRICGKCHSEEDNCHCEDDDTDDTPPAPPPAEHGTCAICGRIEYGSDADDYVKCGDCIDAHNRKNNLPPESREVPTPAMSKDMRITLALAKSDARQSKAIAAMANAKATKTAAYLAFVLAIETPEQSAKWRICSDANKSYIAAEKAANLEIEQAKADYEKETGATQ